MTRCEEPVDVLGDIVGGKGLSLVMAMGTVRPVVSICRTMSKVGKSVSSNKSYFSK